MSVSLDNEPLEVLKGHIRARWRDLTGLYQAAQHLSRRQLAGIALSLIQALKHLFRCRLARGQRSPRLSSRDRMQRLNLRFHLLPHEPQIVLSLQIDPDLRLSAEDPRKPHRHIRRDRCATVDDRRDVLAGHPERIGHLRHGDAKSS